MRTLNWRFLSFERRKKYVTKREKGRVDSCFTLNNAFGPYFFNIHSAIAMLMPNYKYKGEKQEIVNVVNYHLA